VSAHEHDDFDDLIDELEDVLAEGTRVPFSRRLLVDEERILTIIDRMRVAVPEAVKQARLVVQERDRLLDQAQARVVQVMEEHGIDKVVESERQRLLQEAERESASVRAGADAYAREVLQELDEQLVRLLTNVRNGLESLSHTS
jgi:hypothetical protein